MTNMRCGSVAFLLSALLLTAVAAAAQEPPPPPPLPWHVDAYIGFERASEFDPPGSGEQWYWQNSLQISGAKVKLHKQTVACREGKLWSMEGNGGHFFEGTLTGSLKRGNVALREVGCESCLIHKPQPEEILQLRQLSDQVIRMGSVVYDKSVKPYPDQCPAIGHQARLIHGR